jgi:integrase
MSDRHHPVAAEVEQRIGAVTGARPAARDACFFLLIFRQGWRVSAACGLALSPVDSARRVLHVHRLQAGLSTTQPLRGDALAQFSVPYRGRGPRRSVGVGALLVRGHPLGHPCAMILGHAPSVLRSLSLGVVENHAERVTVSRPDAADAMAEMHAIHAAWPLHRALMHREQHAIPLP